MIMVGEGSREQIERQLSMLRNMIQYCEDQVDCRRVQVLAYFNEKFNKADCDAQCDNCNSTSTYESKDFTAYASKAISLTEDIHRSKVTIVACIDIFRGVGAKKSKDFEHLDGYGAGSDLSKNEVERLFYRLVGEGALEENNVVNRAGFVTSYIAVSTLLCPISFLVLTCDSARSSVPRLQIRTTRLQDAGSGRLTRTKGHQE